MNLKQLINQSIYGTIGYIVSQDNIDLLELYVLYNLPVLKEYKQVVVATNYGSPLQNANIQLWKKYFPNCVILNSKINRGHNFGTADLDNLVFDWCKKNNEEWLCKAANDVILQEIILGKQIEEVDFYYLNGISYETLYLNNFNSEKLLEYYFYPQTNFYFIRVSKCDFLNDRNYLDDTYKFSKSIPNYNGKIWEYLKGWSCENLLKNCVKRNRLSKEYLLDLRQHKRLCEAIKMYRVGDPSHKNIMIDGICHFQFPSKNIIKI